MRVCVIFCDLTFCKSQIIFNQSTNEAYDFIWIWVFFDPSLFCQNDVSFVVCRVVRYACCVACRVSLITHAKYCFHILFPRLITLNPYLSRLDIRSRFITVGNSIFFQHGSPSPPCPSTSVGHPHFAQHESLPFPLQHDVSPPLDSSSVGGGGQPCWVRGGREEGVAHRNVAFGGFWHSGSISLGL